MCAVHFFLAFPTGSVYFVDWQNKHADFYRINRIELKSGSENDTCGANAMLWKWNRCLNEWSEISKYNGNRLCIYIQTNKTTKKAPVPSILQCTVWVVSVVRVFVRIIFSVVHLIMLYVVKMHSSQINLTESWPHTLLMYASSFIHAPKMWTCVHPKHRYPSTAAWSHTRKQQPWQKNSINQSELEGAVQQSSLLQFIRTLLARCFIEVGSQIIPQQSSITERIWDHSTAASSCHYNSCPTMLPGARTSKHNWPFWSLRMRLT